MLRNSLPIGLLERMAVVLRVLAHPHRLKVIEMLEERVAAPVSQIQLAIKLPQSATSQHLNHMKKVGLVKSTRRGKEVWYEINDTRALTILNCIRKSNAQVMS